LAFFRQGPELKTALVGPIIRRLWGLLKERVPSCGLNIHVSLSSQIM